MSYQLGGRLPDDNRVWRTLKRPYLKEYLNYSGGNWWGRAKVFEDKRDLRYYFNEGRGKLRHPSLRIQFRFRILNLPFNVLKTV